MFLSTSSGGGNVAIVVVGTVDVSCFRLHLRWYVDVPSFIDSPSDPGHTRVSGFIVLLA